MKLTILGGGFAGVWAAMSAAAERHRQGISPNELGIHLINKSPNIVIRPRLYEGAVAAMKVPLQPLLDEINVTFQITQVMEIIPDINRLTVGDANKSQTLPYERLILATGSELRPPPIDGADRFGFSIDTYEETIRFDRHLAAQLTKRGRDKASATVVVVGGSFTGIELVTELRRRFGNQIRLILLDRHRRAWAEMGASIAQEIDQALVDCAIELKLGVDLVAVDDQGVSLSTGEFIEAKTVVFNTGLQASPLTEFIKAEKDPSGRVVVGPYLQAEGNPSIFFAGDVAHAWADDAHTTLMSCQHALSLGKYAGHNAVRSLTGKALTPYRQETYTTCLALGPSGAVRTTGWDREVQKSGFEGQVIKNQITQEYIYPPTPEVGAQEIFKQFSLAPEFHVN